MRDCIASEWIDSPADVHTSISTSLMEPFCCCQRRTGNPFFLASSVALGVSTATLHRLEMGEQDVTLKTLEHLSDRFHCKISELFGEERWITAGDQPYSTPGSLILPPFPTPQYNAGLLLL